MFLLFFIQLLSLNFAADCTSNNVGVAYGPCDNDERVLVFYWKEECDNKFELPSQKVVACDYECGLEGEYARAYFDASEGVCKKCQQGYEPPYYYILHTQWDTLPDGFTLSPNDGTGWRTDGLSITTGLQKMGCDISFTFSADIVSSYGVFYFTYEGHYNGYNNRADVYVDGLFTETLTLDGKWHTSWSDLGYGQHSLTVRYRSSPYYEPTSVGVRITVLYVYGSGYLPLACQPCPPGTYGAEDNGYCYSCYENTFSNESAVLECTPCEENEYATYGATKCLQKTICKDNDFFEVYGACENNVRTITYEHIYPQLCTGSYQPESRTERCSNCNPGFYYDGTNCLKCADGTYRNESSESELKCESCPEGQAAYQTTYFTKANLLEGTNFTTDCHPQNSFADDLYCYYRTEDNSYLYHGWESTGNSFISGKYYNGPVLVTLTYTADVSWGGSFTFSFSTHLQSSSEFLYWTSNEYFTEMATVVSENLTRQEVTIRIDYTSTIYFQFSKRGMGFGSNGDRLVDYVEIHYLMVTGDQKAQGGAVECRICGVGQSVLQGTSCSLCPKGTASTEEQATCIPCEGNTYADMEGMGECLPCGDGSVATPDHQSCIIETCGFTIGDDVYDLSPLNNGTDMYGPIEVRNYQGKFFFSICNYKNLSDYCHADDDITNSINSLACEVAGNPGVPHNLGNLTNIAYYSNEENAETGVNMTYFGGETVNEAGNILRTAVEILFICFPNSGIGKPVKTKNDFLVNQTYHFRWESEYGCRLCREDDYEEFPGDCVKPGKRTYSWVLKNGSVCSHGYEVPLPTVRNCKLPVITMNGGGLAGIIIGSIAVIVIIVLSLVLLIRKNRKLRYQLFQTQTLQAGGAQGGAGVTGMRGVESTSTSMFKN